MDLTESLSYGAVTGQGRFLNESSALSSSYSNSNLRNFSKRNWFYICWSWVQDGFTIISICFAALSVAVTIALTFQLKFGSPQVSPRGAVASDEGVCSTAAGVSMLRQQGSAVDAAIATLLCLSVTHPHLVGIGGGGVMLVHDHLQMKSRVINFLPSIPANFNPQKRTSDIGGGSVAIPGFLQGLHKAHELYGQLPWVRLFDPAINVARNGFTVSASLEAALSMLNIARIPAPSAQFERSNVAKHNDSSFFTMFLPFGVRLKQGTKLYRRPYAELLKKVAELGPLAVFGLDYSVEVVKLLKDTGSSITVTELQNYMVLVNDATITNFRNETIITAGEPFGGSVMLGALQLLENTSHSNSTIFDHMVKPSQEQLYGDVVTALRVVEPIYDAMAVKPSLREQVSSELLELTADISLKDFSDALFQATNKVAKSTKRSADESKTASDGVSLSQVNVNFTDKAAAEVATRRNEKLSKLFDLALNGDLIDIPRHASAQVSVVDTYDLYVSAVSGLGSAFGSQLMTPHGVLLNNLLASVPNSAHLVQQDFAFQAPVTKPYSGSLDIQDTESTIFSQLVHGSLRPIVPYSPFIVINRHMVCGSRLVCSSGSISDSVQVLAQYFLRKMSINSAVAQPRISIDPHTHAILLDGTLAVLGVGQLNDRSGMMWRSTRRFNNLDRVRENDLGLFEAGSITDLAAGLRMPGSVRNFLQSRGNTLALLSPPYSSVNTVSKFRDDIFSHSDTRGGGLAARLGSNSVPDEEQSVVMPAVEWNERGEADKLSSVIPDPLEPLRSDIRYPEDPSNIAREIKFPNTTERGSSANISDKEKTSGTPNKKFMGDAEHFTTQGTVVDYNSPNGTGVVVKGDVRGGIEKIRASKKPAIVPNKLNPVGDDAGTHFVNGGRGGDSSVNLFPQSNHITGPVATNTVQEDFDNSNLPGNGQILLSDDVPDSVFSDYDRLRSHFSQVRLDDYSDNAGRPSQHVPLDIWGHPVILSSSGLPVPARVASQVHRNLVRQQQLPADTNSHAFTPDSRNSLRPTVLVNKPGDLPIVYVTRHAQQHPVLGSLVSGAYSDVKQ